MSPDASNFRAFPVTVPLAFRDDYPRHRAVRDAIERHRGGGPRAPVMLPAHRIGL